MDVSTINVESDAKTAELKCENGEPQHRDSNWDASFVGLNWLVDFTS